MKEFDFGIYTPDKSSYLRFKGLVEWSLLRHKYLLPTFSIVQVFLSIAIVYGLALLIPKIEGDDAIYLSSGAMVIGIIAVGCVLAAQIVSDAKQAGITSFQQTLPVKSYEIIIADVIIWTLASLPGIAMSYIAALLRFHIHMYISPIGITVIILTQITMILIGFSIAYWLPTNMVALVTQVIMIGGLLFSPITYPASRIPHGLTYIYQFFPFVPASNLVRSLLFRFENFRYIDLAIMFIWMIVCFFISNKALKRKG